MILLPRALDSLRPASQLAADCHVCAWAGKPTSGAFQRDGRGLVRACWRRTQAEECGCVVVVVSFGSGLASLGGWLTLARLHETQAP